MMISNPHPTKPAGKNTDHPKTTQQQTLDKNTETVKPYPTMEQTMQTDQPTVRPTRQRSVAKTALDLSIKTLILQGASVRKTAKALNVSNSTVQAVRSSMTQAGQDPQAYVTTHRTEMLGKLTDHIFDKGLKMKKFRGSDVTTTMKDYRAVAFPSRQESGGDSYSFVQINMNAATPVLQGLGPDPTTTGSVLDDGNTMEAEFVNEIKESSVG